MCASAERAVTSKSVDHRSGSASGNVGLAGTIASEVEGVTNATAWGQTAGAGGSGSMAFYGKYLEVVPNERIVWTNDEGEEGAVTTVTFEDQGGKTLLNLHEVYPSKEALEEALQGGAAALPEQLEQLDELLSSIGE